MNFRFIRYLRTGFLLLVGLTVLAETTPRLRIPKVVRAPKLQDFLEGIPREAETVVTGLRQYGPNDGAPVSQESTAYLSYDDKNLYVAWVCKQDPKTLRAHIMKRDSILNEDRVSVSLDTFHDRHRNYWFDVNPYGVQMDGVTVDGQDDLNYDTVWYSDAKITADGYMVLITVPFLSIRFPDRPVQEWGIVLNRLLPGNNEMSCWPYITPKIQGWSSQFATLEGLENLSQGRNTQIIPYAMAARAKELDTSIPAYQRQTETRAGVDAKWIIQDAITMDATINPDFSQVESDEPQVTVNQRYEVYFPEKRPFFLENANLFQTPVNLFFSRRIADPSVGLRLSGKADQWGMGMLATDDRAPGERTELADLQRGRRTGVGVLRVFREIGTRNRVGLLYSERQIGKDYNRVGSLDTRVQFDDNWTLNGQGIFSDTQAEDDRSSGTAWFAKLSRFGKHFTYSGIFEDYGKDFKTELGYVPRVDLRRIEQDLGYKWRPEQGNLLSFGPSLSIAKSWNHENQVQEWWVNEAFDFEFPRQTLIHIFHYDSYEIFQNEGLRTQFSNINIGSDCTPWLALSGGIGQGTYINYYPKEGTAPFVGRFRQSQAGLTLRPLSRCVLENTYIHNEFLKFSETGGPDHLVYDTHIFRSKLNVYFTREFSLRMIVDFNSVMPDISLIKLERTKRTNVDVLLTYMLHPGTAVYLGYTEGKENWEMDPTRPPNLWRTDKAGLVTGSQIYFKLSYLFRL